MTVSDANGCTASTSFTVDEAPDWDVDIVVDSDINCPGNAFGSIRAEIDNFANSGNVNYAWSNGVIGSTNSNLAAGVYSVTATNTSGCLRIETIELSTPPNPELTFNITSPACGTADGALTAVVNGSITNPHWNGPNSAFFTGTSISNLDAGTYIFNFNDADGCFHSRSIDLINNPPLAGYLSVGVEQQPATCPSAPSSCTYSFSGSPCTGTITLNPGETLCVNSGIFDCDLNMQGGTVYVAAGATFDPNILLENEGTIINCGTVNFLSLIHI